VSSIRILFFCPQIGNGGAEMHLVRLVNNLDSKSYEKYVITNLKNGDYEKLLNKDCKLIHIKETINNQSSTIRIIKSCRPLARFIQELKPQIVFSILDHANIMTYLALKLSGHKCRLVISVQTSVRLSLGKSLNLFRRLIYWAIPKVYPKVDLIICLSNGVKDELIKYAKISKSKVTVINNIGIDSIASYENNLRNNNLVIACGRLVKLKGYDELIKAIHLVKTSLPDIKLKIIGDGPEKKRLKQLIKALCLEQNVVLEGFVSKPMEIIKTGAVFAHSSHYEGFGNVLIEAMAVGTPVISTDCPYGPREIIDDMENGILVPVSNVKIMSQKIIQVLNEKPLSTRLSQNGIIRAMDFGADKISKLYSQQFQNILN